MNPSIVLTEVYSTDSHIALQEDSSLRLSVNKIILHFNLLNCYVFDVALKPFLTKFPKWTQNAYGKKK